MKGEKGSADYKAVDEWVVKWITTFNDVWLKKHPKTFRQAVYLIVNFDESGFQYKSIPQYSLVKRNTEIRAKKPVKARLTGLFGATASGHKFKPLIIGKARWPRAFKDIKNLNELPV